MTITKSVTGMNTIINLHHANKALTEVHNLYSEDLNFGIAEILASLRKSGSRNTMVTSDFKPEVEI